MPWNALAAADFLAQGFNPSEKTAITAIAGAADNIPVILTAAINQVRGYCLAGSNRVGPLNTIPDQLQPETIALARWRLLTSFPQFKALQSAERKQENDDAKALLKDIAKGVIKVELPAEGTALDLPSPESAIQVASANQREASSGTSALDTTKTGNLDSLI